MSTPRKFWWVLSLILLFQPARSEPPQSLATGSQTVEVALNFVLSLPRVDGNNVTFDARTIVDEKELGLEISLSNTPLPVKTEHDESSGPSLPWLNSGIAIRSIGSPTASLEEWLNSRFSHDLGVEHGKRRIIGLYSAYACQRTASLADIAIYRCVHVGITFDADGKEILGECFLIIAVVDAPMKRLTLYFSLPGGYGGQAERDRFRATWLKKLNDPTEPTKK